MIKKPSLILITLLLMNVIKHTIVVIISRFINNMQKNIKLLFFCTVVFSVVLFINNQPKLFSTVNSERSEEINSQVVIAILFPVYIPCNLIVIRTVSGLHLKRSQKHLDGKSAKI